MAQHGPLAYERLVDTSLHSLVLELDRLEAEVRRLRMLVSAPERCEVMLEETSRLRDGVDRFAFALIAAHVDALLDVSGGETPDAEGVRRRLTALADGICQL